MKIVFICSLVFLVVSCAVMVFSILGMDAKKEDKKPESDYEKDLEEVKRINEKYK